MSFYMLLGVLLVLVLLLPGVLLAGWFERRYGPQFERWVQQVKCRWRL